MDEEKIARLESEGVYIRNLEEEMALATPPKKLKLQAVSQETIASVQKYFLTNMLKQAQEARSLAIEGMKEIEEDSMTQEERQTFLNRLSENIEFLQDRLSEFDTYYKRVVENGKRIVQLPDKNFENFRKNGLVARIKRAIFGNKIEDTLTNTRNSQEGLNRIYEDTRKQFQTMPKPKFTDYQVENVDTNAIKQEVDRIFSEKTNQEKNEMLESSFARNQTKRQATNQALDSFLGQQGNPIEGSVSKEVEEGLKDVIYKSGYRSERENPTRRVVPNLMDDFMVDDDSLKMENPSFVEEKEKKEEEFSFGSPFQVDSTTKEESKDLSIDDLRRQLLEMQEEEQRIREERKERERVLANAKQRNEDAKNSVQEANEQRDRARKELEEKRNSEKSAEEEIKNARVKVELMQQINEVRNRIGESNNVLDQVTQEIRSEKSKYDDYLERQHRAMDEEEKYRTEGYEVDQRISEQKRELTELRNSLTQLTGSQIRSYNRENSQKESVVSPNSRSDIINVPYMDLSDRLSQEVDRIVGHGAK